MTAPIFACPRKSGSMKASLDTSTPPSSASAKRSALSMPSGNGKPKHAPILLMPTMPSVFPKMSATSTDAVSEPMEPNFTPALARPKKNMPKSTGIFIVCSNT
eukprot:CAMPEP_0180526002 /NCGR_PEP_ID=MMETSP1036_2-20121128/59463_1 /TAXON_ID=632150 /ORGANISM="Azadinium spinosum, Strain 3D9" /LENGTH=102 /DNA_ID=CAMNT_0022539327 /DNA_START=37 /DNA_END=345 /DNA_ORIENTATION=-